MTLKKSFWHAVYVKPRCEKKVYNTFLIKGIEAYCPIQKISKKWSDRYKIVEEPVFKSYVFVKIEETQKSTVRLSDGVVNFVFNDHKPAIISEKEILTIKKFLKDYTEVTVEKLEIKENQVVKIVAGVLMDQTAIVKKVMKNKLVVELKSLRLQLVTVIHKNEVILIENSIK